MDQDGTGGVPADRITRLKLDVVRALGPLATAVLLDPQYSIPHAIDGVAIPAGIGLLASLPNALPAARPPAQVGYETFTVADAREIGACGVKLYLPYHPDGGERTAQQERLVAAIAAQCAAEQIPLFLEPVLVTNDPDMVVDSPAFARRRRTLALQTAERLGRLGPDILKLEFPIDWRFETNEATWREACEELSTTSNVPWALLSAGAPIDVFAHQLQIACEAGCSGYIAGRSLWHNAATADEHERQSVLRQITPRMQALNDIAERYGQDWRTKKALPD
jgi:tagatose-1,6-bisphosphate aldolase